MNYLRLSLAAVFFLIGTSIAAEEALNSGFKLVYSVYRHCEISEDPVACLKARAVKMVDRALHSETIQIFDGVSLIKRPDEERSLSEALEPLPTDLEARSNKVDDLLWGRLGAFMDSHSLQFKLPSFVQGVVEEEDGEGRGKKKKILPALLLGLMLKGSLLAIALKGLALLAAKALLVSKLALLLAGIIALKKLFSSGGEKTTYEIVKQPIVSHSHEYSSSHEGGFEHGGGYGRSLNLESNSVAAQRLAYRGYKQANSLE